MLIRCGLPIVLLAVITTAGCETGSRSQTQASVPAAVPYTAAIASSPEEALHTAEILRDAGANSEALRVLANAHRRYPDNSAVTSAYGRLVLLGGDVQSAERLLREAVAANPNDWRALSALGVVESRKGQHGAARATLGKANAISKREAVALNNLAIGHLLAGKPELAVKLLRQALGGAPLKSEHAYRIRRNLALALAVEGRFAEAETLAGERFPRWLKQAEPAIIRRFLGMEETRDVPSLSQEERDHLARGWRPVEKPYGR